MSLIGNVLWFIFGGFITAALYFVSGFLMCCTIIGIPFGLQLLKFGLFALFPFGHDVISESDSGCLMIIFNILWVFLGWWEIAVVHVVFGLLFCITIIGIPLGMQHFKMAGYSFMPFGKTIV